MEGLLRKENDAKKAAFDDTTVAPKSKKQPIKKRKIKELFKQRVCCRRCGYMLGHIEIINNKWDEWIRAMSKKFGTTWPICKNCRSK